MKYKSIFPSKAVKFQGWGKQLLLAFSKMMSVTWRYMAVWDQSASRHLSFYGSLQKTIKSDKILFQQHLLLLAHSTCPTGFSGPIGFTVPDLWPHSGGFRLPRCVQPCHCRWGSSSVTSALLHEHKTAINTQSPAPGDTLIPPSPHFYTSVFYQNAHLHDNNVFRILLAGYRRAGPDTHCLSFLNIWSSKTLINTII